jgi:hypothetical protein
MRAASLLLPFFGAVQAADVVSVPGGHFVTKECIVEVPNGELYDVDKHEIPANCKAELGIQIYAADVHMKSDVPLTSFYADWTAPQLPTEKGLFSTQVVYFWPGFKAKQPEMGLPVLQPVLQYGEQKKAWMLQSWFVDGNDRSFPVVTAPAIDVSPGDKITSYMNRSADGKTWTVSGTNTRTGKDSTLNIAFAKAGNTDYDYAMLVNENINVNTECDRMPAGDGTGKGSVTFTNVKVNGKVPQWTTRANCKGNKQCDCDNSAKVSSTGDVTLGWNTGKSAHESITV